MCLSRKKAEEQVTTDNKTEGLQDTAAKAASPTQTQKTQL